MDERFFAMADELVSGCQIVLDRPKGTTRPRRCQNDYSQAGLLVMRS